MFKVTGPVIAHVPFTARAPSVLTAALSHARDADVPLIACAVLPEIYRAGSFAPGLQADGSARFLEMEERTRRWLEELLRGLIPAAMASPEIVVESGTPHRAVSRLARERSAGLVVVDAGDSPGNRPIALHRVVQDAGSSVLVTRPPAAGAVLAATDLSDPSLPALRAGAHEARRLHAQLAFVHAVDLMPIPVPMPPWEAVQLVPSVSFIAQKDWATGMLAEFAGTLGATEVVVEQGAAAEVIVRYATELPARLVVVGTHGRSGFDRMALGSVAESVVETAPCSVLVVRIDAPPSAVGPA